MRRFLGLYPTTWLMLVVVFVAAFVLPSAQFFAFVGGILVALVIAGIAVILILNEHRDDI